MTRDIGEPPETAEEIGTALAAVSPAMLTAKAEAMSLRGDWIVPSRDYQGNGHTVLEALQNLWRRLREPLKAEGTVIWREEPTVVSFMDFETKLNGWAAYCCIGVFRPEAARD
jgi:hypothetical protein